jgi:copper(I)-binding protein
LLLLTAGPCLAGDLSVSAGLVRPPVLPGGNGAAFLTIDNAGPPDRLVGAESPIAHSVELHTHLHDGGVMRMRAVDSIAIPAHGQAVLKPGGDHVMLIGVDTPPKAGDRVPLTLVFAKAGRITLDLPVGSVGTVTPSP